MAYREALVDEMMRPREQGGVMGPRITGATFRDEGGPANYAYDDAMRTATNKYFQDNYGRAGTDAEHQSRADLLSQQGRQAAGAPALSGGTAVDQSSGMSNALGGFAGKLEGFDQGKLSGGHDSPKYQFGRAMSQFDPKGGITQELLDALNALGLGTVSGNLGGDKISIGGNVDPRFEGVTEFDIIRDLENGGGWQWGGLNGKAAAPQMRQGGGGMAPSGIGALTQSPSNAINAALANSRTPNIDALLAQLAGG